MSEVCPFCKTEVNPGATVCIGCGAYQAAREEGGWKALKIMGNFFLFVCIIPTFLFSSLQGVVGAFIGNLLILPCFALGIWLFWKKVKSYSEVLWWHSR